MKRSTKKIYTVLLILFVLLFMVLKCFSLGIITAFGFGAVLLYVALYIKAGHAFICVGVKNVNDYIRFWAITFFFILSALFFRDSDDVGPDFGLINAGNVGISICMFSIAACFILSIATIYISNRKNHILNNGEEF